MTEDKCKCKNGKEASVCKIECGFYKERHKFNTCPEIPFFGATYPDACCIDGYLWDLDKCDENGLYGSGDNPPCPFCNVDEFLEDHKDDDNYDREKTLEWIEALRTKYS